MSTYQNVENDVQEIVSFCKGRNKYAMINKIHKHETMIGDLGSSGSKNSMFVQLSNK